MGNDSKNTVENINKKMLLSNVVVSYCNCTKKNSWWNQLNNGKECWSCKKAIHYLP